MKTSNQTNFRATFRATLAACTFATASAVLTAAAPVAPWLGLGAGLVISGDVLAATRPIIGIGIRVKKSPGGQYRSAPLQSGPDGSFHLTGLEPGDYEVTPDGGKPAMFKVGADGKLSGVVRAEGAVQTNASPQPGNAVEKIKERDRFSIAQ